MKNNFKLWSATCVLALAGFASSSNAGSIEAVDANSPSTASGWAISVDASATVLGVNPGNLGNNGGAADETDFYVDKPIMAVKVTSPNGVIEFEGIFDLETITRRHLNLNEDGDKYSSLDGTPARHILQELTAKYAASESLYVKAGLGTVNYMEKERNTFATRPLQNASQLRERLFAEVGYTLDQSGTQVMVSIFDGTEQKAVDLMDDFSIRDFAEIQDLNDRADSSVSFAARVSQKLGNSGLEASIGYARINNRTNTGDSQDRVAVSLKGQYMVSNWALTGLVQFVQTFDDIDLSSTVAEVTASNGKLTAYVRGEWAQTSANSDDDVLRGTAGIEYTLVDSAAAKISPFLEILAEDRAGDDNGNYGMLAGIRISGGTTQIRSKSE